MHPTIATTLPELIKRVRALPGKYSYGSTGQGGIIHLAGELFKMKAGGLDIVHVPYREPVPAERHHRRTDSHHGLMALGTAHSYHRAGKLRALAAFSEQRSQVAPEIPTIARAWRFPVWSYSCVLLAARRRTPRR